MESFLVLTTTTTKRHLDIQKSQVFQQQKKKKLTLI